MKEMGKSNVINVCRLERKGLSYFQNVSRDGIIKSIFLEDNEIFSPK